MTEINVTSPTGIHEVRRFGGADIAALVWDAIERKAHMITLRKSEDRGHNKIDWLESRHSFSFGDYYDPAFESFGRCALSTRTGSGAARAFRPIPTATWRS